MDFEALQARLNKDRAERETREREWLARAEHELFEARMAIARLVGVCKLAHEDCLRPNSFLAQMLAREIRKVEPDWIPPPSAVGSR